MGVIAVAVVIAVAIVLVSERIDARRTHRVGRASERGIWAFRALGGAVVLVGGVVTGEWLAVGAGLAVVLVSGAILAWLRRPSRGAPRARAGRTPSGQ